MFSSALQTGTSGVEILSPAGTGKDQRHAAFTGAVSRSYERDLKGYCYDLSKSGPSTAITCPASGRDSLGVIQPLLVLQIHCPAAPAAGPAGEKVSIEITVMSAAGQRLRLHFSSSFRAMECNGLHAQVPWAWVGVPPGRWTEAVLDLPYTTARCFQGAQFASIHSV